MSTNYRETKNDLVSCPFNPAHKVKKCRLITHKKICPDKENKGYVICPYNPSHHVSKENLEKHKDKCPNKVILNSELEREMEEFIKNKNNMKIEKKSIYKSPKEHKENVPNNQNEIEGLKIKKNKKKKSDKKAKEKKEEIKEKAIDLETITNKELYNFIFEDKMLNEYDSDSSEKNDDDDNKESKSENCNEEEKPED